ncbi:MAG TPA: tRNA (adenosine(37)-N6)-threonylcarbamoyltransferase complex dimerization subunit type 1 TsaB [Pirellulales bacterium]|jgi:tRNA threonylcarbamoyladenosine biosynthesis protein TsaB|nr:tRNA (adenosine(37)-N6)-threonylcarbamoyltransferase complex dimerization subunit type 1 TsaB [Pirellulales bacterium]
MRILALETSGSSGSVAALDASQLILEQALAGGSRSAQSLAPGIEALLAEVGWSLGQVDLIAVTQGPGSFTGLRIGVTTAKALAYAVAGRLVGVNTLAVIARQAPVQQTLWTVLDAQRGELFAARFSPSAPDCHAETIEVQVVDRDTWLAQLAAGDAVSGPGLERLEPGIRSDVTVVGRQFWLPKAETVGRLGYERSLVRGHDDLFQLTPQYFRQAAAEEKWERQHGPTG